MKKNLSLLVVAMSLLCSPVFSQAEDDTTDLLGLAGDNLDLYAVLTLFQKSKTIEAFEKSLNDEQTKINNLDLNLDKKVDFIKVTTTKKDSAFTFILQVDVTKTETQDVAVILVNKEKGKVSIQTLVTRNCTVKIMLLNQKGILQLLLIPVIPEKPCYCKCSGNNYCSRSICTNRTVCVFTGLCALLSALLLWILSALFCICSCDGMLAYIVSNHYYYHGGYHGGHYGGGNTVIINNGNRNQINHYNNNSRNTSNTVANNKANGGYGDGRGSGNRGSTGVNNNMRGSNTNRGSTGVSNNMSNNRGSTSRPSTSNNMSSNRGSTTQTINIKYVFFKIKLT